MSLRVERLRTRGQQYLIQKQWDAAAATFESLLALEPGNVDALLAFAKAQSSRGHVQAAHGAALRAHELAPKEPRQVLELATRLRLLNESGLLVDLLRTSGIERHDDAEALLEQALSASTINAHEESLVLVDRVLELAPANAEAHYLRGNVLMFFGRMDEAEAELEHAIALKPQYPQAHWVLSRLRRQTLERNHAQRIRARLAESRRGGHGEAYLSFALHNELHDLGQYGDAWRALERGCAAKRNLTPYDHEATIRIFEDLKSLCTADFVQPASSPEGAFIPIFVIGMHRSGTTLLERILGGHSQVIDGGETYLFTGQMKIAADTQVVGVIDQRLLDRAAAVDYGAVGAGFLRASAWRARGHAYLTEKLPSNFLHAGFIAKALPQARFLHMRRDARETCFSNLRTLFSDIASYSYDQLDMADYFRRYLDLMAHWHRVMPGRILDVSYDALVTHPDEVAREVFEFCGLPFERDALNLQRGGAVSTASSAQVRGGINKRRTPDWQHYQRHLQPMLDALDGVS